MIPYNDIEPNRYTSWPFMTLAIICSSVIIMGVEEVLAESDFPRLVEMIHLYGVNPWLIYTQQGGGGLTAVTNVFIHGDLIHLLGNMMFLWVYGRRVEDLCGPWRFLLFYLCCGAFASLIVTLTEFYSDVPGIGASGAIAGVMGAYLMLFPKGRIRTLLLLGWIPLRFTIRAYWLILYFLAWQIIPALDILLNRANYSIGYWAHLGGFFGGLFVFFFLRPEAFYRYHNELPL